MTSKNSKGRAARAALAALALAAPLLVSCSSAPPKPTQLVAKRNQAAQYAEIGNGYFAERQLDTALSFYQMALEIAISVDYPEGKAQSYGSIGRVYMEARDFAKAELAFQQGLKASEESGEGWMVAMAKVNLGELRLLQGRRAEALAEYEAALPLIAGRERDAKEGARKASALVYHGYASALKLVNDASEAPSAEVYDKAIAHFEKAMAINKEEPLFAEYAANAFMIASIRMRKARMAIAASDPKARDAELAKAEEALKLALEYDRKAENPGGIAKDYAALAGLRALADPSDLRGAYDALSRAYDIYLTTNYGRELLSILPRLIELAEGLGLVDDAARYVTAQRTLQERLSGAAGE